MMGTDCRNSLFLKHFQILKEQRIFSIRGKQKTGARRYGKVFDCRTVHQTAVLELLAEKTAAVTGQPAKQLFVRELFSVGGFGQAEGFGRVKPQTRILCVKKS